MEILKEYVITQGDTLHTVSQKVFGGIEHALEIAIANELDYPFISDSYEGTGKVLTPGDIALIPILVSKEPELLDSIVGEEALGTDLLLVHPQDGNLGTYYNGDLITDRYGDIQSVVGVGSLKQDLIHRLVTVPGTLVCHPEWGSEFMNCIGAKNTFGWREDAKVALERCFRSDDRVENVTDIEVTQVPTGVEISCTIVTKQGIITLREMIQSRGGADIGV